MPSPLKALCGMLVAVLLVAPPAAADESTVDEAGATADPVRLMPLGDSITQGGSIGGYRLDLGTSLRAAGRTVDFVGSLADGPGSMPDRNHEGHPGWTTVTVTPAPYNITIAASGSVTFGFIASGASPAAIGAATCSSP